MISAPIPHRSLSALVHAFRGRPGVVMGGAPSLPHDLERLSNIRNAVYLSVNDHGVRPGLANAPAEVHAIVAGDDIEARLRPYGLPIIAPRYWADYRVLHHSATNSAILACLAAWVMGCAPIVVIGVEMYRGKTYWHDPAAQSVGRQTPPYQHMKRWRGVAERLPGAMLRSVSGPLTEIFKPWNPLERPEPITSTSRILAIIGGTWIEITKDCPWYGTHYKAGEVIETKTHEAGLMIAKGLARSRRRGEDSEIIEIDQYS